LVKDFSTENIRNLCLAGQRGCGKTSLADALAYHTGANNRIGRVDDGSSLFDYNETEISRKSSISTKLLATVFKNRKLNLLDCPGHPDFIGELLTSVRVTEAVCMVVDAVAGVEVGTQLQWKSMREKGLARFIFVNKMDKENVNWQKTVDSLQKAFGNHAVPIQLPIGQSDSFAGVIDLVHMKAYKFESGKPVETDIPADIKSDAESYREALIEMAAESDDALMEKFFEAGTLDATQTIGGLRTGIAKGTLFPILFGSVAKDVGPALVLEFAAEYLPSPDQMSPVEGFKTGTEEATEIFVESSGEPMAYVYKTSSESQLGELTFFKVFAGTLKPGAELVNQHNRAVERMAQLYTVQGKNRVDVTSLTAGDIGVAVKLKGTHSGNTLTGKGISKIIKPTVYPNPVMDVAIRPKKKGDEDKIASGLQKLHEEDPTFQLISDAALKQQVLFAQGSTHIEVLTEKLQKRFGVEVELAKPKIPYRETVTGKIETQYRHKKQSGGRGQYGDVHIRIEPNERGGGFVFQDEIKGGVIPGKFIPAVEKGVVESMEHGGLCGAPVVDVKVSLFFGSYHDVDSSDMAFKIAGLMAFKQGYLEARPVILEPIYKVEVLIPNEFTGDVMGDMSSRRGRVAGMDPEGTSTRIKAEVPRSELYQYSVDLRSMTQGQGIYRMDFARYEQVPHEVAQKIIEEAKREQAAE